MWNFFKGPKGPLRIKSVKELDPRFRPRWYKIEVGLWIFAFLTLIFFDRGF